jgi:hypothetical protein
MANVLEELFGCLAASHGRGIEGHSLGAWTRLGAKCQAVFFWLIPLIGCDLVEFQDLGLARRWVVRERG